MDTRSNLPEDRCVYCLNNSDTNDHAPPQCLLRSPLPSNLMTVPACQKCNSGFSFQENVVRALLTLVSDHPDLVAERMPDGRLSRALARDARLRRIVEEARQADGNYAWTAEITTSFQRVFAKTAQGLFYGLYNRFISPEHLKLLRVENRRLITPNEVADELRPSPLRDITDEPLSEISENSWHSREPVLVMKLQPIAGGPPVDRIFRLTRETPAEWITFQPNIFSFAFVKREDGGAACILDLWETLIIAVATPWPDDRGPIRKGRKNPFSREKLDS